jgi:hypothetical protein
MSTESKRSAIKSCYKSDSWRKKVDRMTEGQVIAVYLRFLRDGKI